MTHGCAMVPIPVIYHAVCMLMLLGGIDGKQPCPGSDRNGSGICLAHGNFSDLLR